MGMSIMNRRRFLKPAEEAGVVLNLLSPVCMENAMLNRPLRKTVSMLFLASVFMAAPLHAEADPGGPVKAAEETSRKANNLGFAVGYLSGYGFSYRHWFPSKNGYQLTFLPMAFFSDRRTPDLQFDHVGAGIADDDRQFDRAADGHVAVSYTHLTLPTNREV